MKSSNFVGAAAALVWLAACSDQSVTGVKPSAVNARFALVPTPGGQVCSDASTGFVITKNPGWADAVAGSSWVGKASDAATIGRVRLGKDDFTSTFSVPAGATNISISGKVLADNDVVIDAGGSTVYNSFNTINGTRTRFTYLVAQPDNRTQPVFQTVGGLSFTASAGFVAGSDNTVTFSVYNDDDPNAPFPAANGLTNPSGLSFCYTVNYTPAPPVVDPPLVPVFVIGDVEPHGVGATVNFWGAQWWKNNQMSGTVSNGVASFKGYATEAGLTCGQTWVSRPGNSSNPPATIASRIAVIVTSKVIKNGPDISGDIKEIVLVDQDGGYGPNPGHRGNGKVAKFQCQ